jgi:hypothetical protein
MDRPADAEARPPRDLARLSAGASAVRPAWAEDPEHAGFWIPATASAQKALVGFPNRRH